MVQGRPGPPPGGKGLPPAWWVDQGWGPALRGARAASLHPGLGWGSGRLQDWRCGPGGSPFAGEGLAPISPPTPRPVAGTHTLQLARVQPSDSGTYMCEALNAAGRDQKLVQLSVLGASRPNPHLHCPPLRQSAPQPHTPQGAQVGGGLRRPRPPAATASRPQGC